ncbi:multiheme c-type cytochrome [Echinimonas agarilytica]|uniref:Cytochrome c-552/4 domain-containing protein n=1 Tax=Echinimonas agarilytica TaxID=1215918 RepID=A0AA41W3P9_9GAMM|nr:multiheme c-type cytochrome [Echinimonas agarilytica]MCM2678225.1 hypothetical protein [Echinimonas agarilytica]
MKFFIALLMCLPYVAYSADFVGSGQCVSCHEQEHEQWQASDHAKSMLPATAQSVLGRFDSIETTFHELTFKPYQKGDEFWVDTVTRSGKVEAFKVAYVFGHFPLQQYVIDIGDGHLQAHNVAWDSRSKQEGGQRWIHLQPNEKITIEHPFFWQGAYQNLNSRCAECHTTNYEKNYDVATNSYQTTWSEVNVACETCHGPASKHVTLANKDAISAQQMGFDFDLAKPLNWTYEAGSRTAVATGEVNEQHISMCGSCHSRRTSMGPLQSSAAQSYHEQFRISNLSDNLYYADGQILDEVFVVGSFLQSKMHEKGVTCSNCHNVHTGKVRSQTNGLCSQCHMPSEFDVKEHHGHEPDSEAAQCVTCHMPENTYMVVDDRRDHSFKVPRPLLADAIGSPSVCQSCHEDKDATWAADEIKTWNGKTVHSDWPLANAHARMMRPNAEQELMRYIKDDELPGIVRATLYEQLAHYANERTLNEASEGLSDSDPLVRRAAAEVYRGTPQEMRWQALSPLLEDPNLQVRASVTAMLADIQPIAPAHIKPVLNQAIAEYRETFSQIMDMPSSHVALALLEQQLGQQKLAKTHYLNALRIDPYYIAAMVNLADIYRNEGDAKNEQAQYEAALKVAPDSAAVQHGFGLFMLRQKRYDESLKYLFEATQQVGAIPQYSFVYAVALDHQGQKGKAIDVLQEATSEWPGQYQLLTTLVSYLQQQNRTSEIMAPLQQLIRLAPNAPQVEQWRQQYMN